MKSQPYHNFTRDCFVAEAPRNDKIGVLDYLHCHCEPWETGGDSPSPRLRWTRAISGSKERSIFSPKEFPAVITTKLQPSAFSLQSFMAFTLIELLVVVAIISILMAMLMPALKSARQAGQNITCINNLHKCGTIFLAYAGDYDG